MEPGPLDDDDDDELMGFELLQQMRPLLDLLEASQLAANDPKLMAAVKRLLEQERAGEADDESEEFYSDLRLVTLAEFRLQFEAQKRAKRNGEGGRAP